MKADKQSIKQATKLGKNAYQQGKKRVPALDSNLRKMLDGVKVGEAHPYLNAWLEGWDASNLEE